MVSQMPKPLAKIMPFIVAGILLVLGIVGFIIVSYILILGVLIGSVLYGIMWVKNKFFPRRGSASRVDSHYQANQQSEQGRIIDHDNS